MAAICGQPAAIWEIDFSNASGAQSGPCGEGRLGRFPAGWDGNHDPDADDRWFLAGGAFEEDVLFANNDVTANMDAIAGIPSDRPLFRSGQPLTTTA